MKITKIKNIHKSIFWFLVFGFLIGLIFLFTINAWASDIENKFYLENQKLYVENERDEKTVLLENIVDYKITNLQEDTENLIVVSTDQKNQTFNKLIIGNWIRFYEIEDINNKIELNLIYENNFTRVKPWSIDAGDLDDDGRKDIFIGAYKATKYYELDKRPFFFNWNGKILSRKWTGSYLSLRKLQEIEFEDLDNDGIDEVKALEKLKNGEIKYSYYKWDKFSFSRVK